MYKENTLPALKMAAVLKFLRMLSFMMNHFNKMFLL